MIFGLPRGIYFTRLGDYDRHQRGKWFTDPRVAEPLAGNLVAAEREIGARNLERPFYAFEDFAVDQHLIACASPIE